MASCLFPNGQEETKGKEKRRTRRNEAFDEGTACFETKPWCSSRGGVEGSSRRLQIVADSQPGQRWRLYQMGSRRTKLLLSMKAPNLPKIKQIL